MRARMIGVATFTSLLSCAVQWSSVAGAQEAPPAPAAAACTEVPEPARWLEVGAPDTGLERGFVSAHRAGTTLAPENTLDAIRVAAAYGVDVVELDFRTTADGAIVVLHDATVDRTTDGTGAVADLTLAEIRGLNAASYGAFADPARPEHTYSPARIPTAEEAIALAAEVGLGIEFDLKDVVDPSVLADQAAAAGILDRSFFNNPEDPRMRAAQPSARFIYNLNDTDPPAALFAMAASGAATYFGSALLEFTPERIAAIHDGCGIAMPHSYDSDPPGGEAADIAQGRAVGTDGNQVNAVDVAVAALGRPVATELVHDGEQLCLRNAANGQGLPYKPIDTDAGTISTARFGCVTVPGGATRASFAGDGSARPAALAPAPVVPEAPTPLALVAIAGAALAAAARRRGAEVGA